MATVPVARDAGLEEGWDGVAMTRVPPMARGTARTWRVGAIVGGPWSASWSLATEGRKTGQVLESRPGVTCDDCGDSVDEA